MKRPVLLSLLLLCLPLLGASACDTEDEACAGGSCERSGPEVAGEPAAPASEPQCRRACETLTGACGEDTTGDTTFVRAVAACIDWCQAGGLTIDEAACLAKSDCVSGIGCLAD